MIDDELAQLRRADPIDAEAVAELMTAHRSSLAAAMREARDDRPTPRTHAVEPTADRPGRRRTIGAVAAAVVVFALPALFFAASSRGDGDILDRPNDQLPSLDELPASEGVDDRTDRPTTSGVDDELFQRVPPSTAVDEPSPTSSPATATPPIDPTTNNASDRTTRTPPPTSAIPSPSPSTSPSPSPSPAESNAPAPGDHTSSPTPVSTSPPTPSSTVAPAAPAPTVPAATDAPIPATTAPAAETAVPLTARHVGQPFDASRDLLVVTLDFANRDDGHAAVATREVATSLAIDLLVVAGTQAPESPDFVQPYDAVMSAAWGAGWLDAGTDRTSAIDTAADRWLDTIDAGGVVRIAEGGVSDFSADVLREVQRRRPTLDSTTVIQLVHHASRNEDETRPGDLDSLRAATTYVRIDDGNSSNDTADLEAPSAAFEAAALAGPHAAAWSIAFEYRSADSLDFSDTVTVLHVLGVGTDVVADPGGFAATFMG